MRLTFIFNQRRGKKNPVTVTVAFRELSSPRHNIIYYYKLCIYIFFILSCCIYECEFYQFFLSPCGPYSRRYTTAINFLWIVEIPSPRQRCLRTISRAYKIHTYVEGICAATPNDSITLKDRECSYPLVRVFLAR